MMLNHVGELIASVAVDGRLAVHDTALEMLGGGGHASSGKMMGGGGPASSGKMTYKLQIEENISVRLQVSVRLHVCAGKLT